MNIPILTNREARSLILRSIEDVPEDDARFDPEAWNVRFARLGAERVAALVGISVEQFLSAAIESGALAAAVGDHVDRQAEVVVDTLHAMRRGPQ